MATKQRAWKEIQEIGFRDCAACAIECPKGVQVPSRLIRARDLLA